MLKSIKFKTKCPFLIITCEIQILIDKKKTEIWKFVGSRHSIWFVRASGLENTLTYETFIGIKLNFVS